MKFLPNPLFKKIGNAYLQKKRIIVNEGGSRSGKTFSIIHWLVAYCSHNKTPKDIYILRDTLINCRDFTLKEFQDVLKLIGIYDNRMMINSPKPVYNLWGHKIKFRGMDDEQAMEGYPSDILFFNEVLENDKGAVNGLMMRCRDLILMDFNPKYSDHWVFELAKRPDTIFLSTTYKDNIKNLPVTVIKEIESYNPNIPENVTHGTADKYRWKVYGLGERANREGLVFPEVKWIDQFPTDIEEVGYGIDFGETAQTAIVKIGIRRKQPKSDLYIQKLFYAPTENSDIVAQVLLGLKIPKHIWADNNMPAWITDLRMKGILIFATKKFPGSREYWITTIKKFNIHAVKDVDLRKEFENFSYRILDGKQLSETIKKYDHLMSATGYCVTGDFRMD